MKVFKIYYIIPFLLLILCYSCIEEYIPRINSSEADKVFIYGQITNVEGLQYIKIYSTSSINNPEEIPLSNCIVKIYDDMGNTFNLTEYKKGEYGTWISKEYLTPGKYFGLHVTTSTGEEIESDLDQMPVCPKIDSIYYERINHPTNYPDSVTQGIQFYLDFDASGNYSNYYKWDIEETWEHHAALPINYYWDGTTLINALGDYTRFVCWTTKDVNDFYILSTENSTKKKIEKHSLHWVSNVTQRLTYGYSILVKQYAISKNSYSFWDQVKSNNNIGGLNGRQPRNIVGNLHNKTNPNKKVLGIFQATAVQTKRIFVKRVPFIDVSYPPCVLPDTKYSPRVKPPLPKRIMYLYEQNGAFWELSAECVLCNYIDGTTIKPDFWPN